MDEEKVVEVSCSSGSEAKIGHYQAVHKNNKSANDKTMNQNFMEEFQNQSIDILTNEDTKRELTNSLAKQRKTTPS